MFWDKLCHQLMWSKKNQATRLITWVLCKNRKWKTRPNSVLNVFQLLSIDLEKFSVSFIYQVEEFQLDFFKDQDKLNHCRQDFFLNSTTLPVWDKGEFNIWGENQYILYKQICFKLVIFLIVVSSKECFFKI